MNTKRSAQRMHCLSLLVVLAASLLLAGPLMAPSSALTPTLCSLTGIESVSPDSLHYSPVEIVYLTGTGFAPSCDVAVEVTQPDGSVVSSSVTTDTSGNLSYSYALESLLGAYTADFSGEGGIALGRVAVTSGPVVTMDKGDYRPGETAQITGVAFPPLSGFTVRITAPDGSVVNIPVNTGAYGTFSADYPIEVGFVAQYSVVALDRRGTVLASTFFTDSSLFVGNFGTASTGPGSFTSLAIPNNGATAAPAGSSIVVAFTSGAAASAFASINGCTDSKGNVYTIDMNVTRALLAERGLAICSAHNIAHPLASGDSITVTFPANDNTQEATANVFSGLQPTGTLDRTHTASGSSNTPTSGTTATTSQADELLVGIFAWNATNDTQFTAGSGYTLTNANVGSANATRLGSEYRFVTSTGEYLAGGSLSSSVAWRAAIATYRIDVTPPSITLTTPANASTASHNTPTFAGTAGTAAGDSSTVIVNVYSGSNTFGTLLQTLTATAQAGAYSVNASSALPDGQYTAQAQQSDTAGNIGFSAANTFTIVAAAITTTMASSATATYGDASVTLSATVTSTSTVNQGRITFTVMQGATAIGTPTTSATLTSGSASADYALPPGTAAGPYTIVAMYSGGTNFLASSDNVGALTINKAPATVSLGNLSQTYDGTPRVVTAATAPPGLTVDITYDGSATAPTDVGSYAVSATVVDGNYDGNATGSLLVGKARATITLSALAYVYDGTPKFAIATTDPVGLTGVYVTYDGLPTPPTDAGSYAVVATLTNDNYQGPDSTGTLVIARAAATIILRNQIQLYDGFPKAVGIATDPAGLEVGVAVTYDGSSTPPTDAGSYAVLATLTSHNYQAPTVTDTLAIVRASAGADQTVNEGDLVTLSGSGYGVTHSWTQMAPASPTVTFSDPSSPTPTFTAPQLDGGFGSATFTFQFTATDGTVSASDTVDVTVKNVNHAPVVLVGGDQEVSEGALVTLPDAGSYDPDGDPITYQWVQTYGPMVDLTGASTPSASFTAPMISGGVSVPMMLKFTLTVSDSQVSVTSSEVVVAVDQINHAPTASAGATQTVNAGAPVTLDGTGSTDPDNDPLLYTWTQTAGPSVTLDTSNPAQPTFTAPASGPLTFKLTVSDGQLSSGESSVTVNVLSAGAAPACAQAYASPNLLWPPNHKLVPVSILGVTDSGTITIVGVTQDEPTKGTGAGDTSPDAMTQNGGQSLLLRAERSGSGDGRVYRVSFTASNTSGSCTGAVTLSVPNDQSQIKTPIDSGQLYNSFQP